jgi:hypothetical protein
MIIVCTDVVTVLKNRLYMCLYLTHVLVTVTCLYTKQNLGTLLNDLPFPIHVVEPVFWGIKQQTILYQIYCLLLRCISEVVHFSVEPCHGIYSDSLYYIM